MVLNSETFFSWNDHYNLFVDVSLGTFCGSNWPADTQLKFFKTT